MLTVGCLLREAEEAIAAAALAPRPAYAMETPAFAAPLRMGDPSDAHARVVCRLFAHAKTENGMLRFTLTDEALMSALPDEAELSAMERAQAGLLDELFAGDLPPAYANTAIERGRGSVRGKNDGHGGSRAPSLQENAALAYARLCVILRKPPQETAAARSLLWASAKTFSKRPLADKQLLRALRPYVADLSVNPNMALRYCRAALGEIIHYRKSIPRM